ncbi:MAG: radical SAM protein [Balneolaceae bacterium]|nr:radical SAM protein [Balneolaceae bacterium]
MESKMDTKKYRTSSYTIYVKLEDKENNYLLVHGYTGAIDQASANVVDFLQKNRVYTKGDELPFSEATFNLLEERGYITEKSPMEEKETVKTMAEFFHKRDATRKNFLFLVAYDCNFRCPYCFENEISSNGKGWSKKVFTKTAVDRAYQTMLELEPNEDLHSKQIILYGGEPLLASNKSIVKYIVEQGYEKGYHFKAITNGYDLEHYKDLIHPNYINKLQITVDGDRETHDSRRTHFETGLSYDKIMENIAWALEAGVYIAVRINTDLNNFDQIKTVRAHFDELGFFEYDRFRVYSALIHGDSEMNCNAVMAAKKEETPATSIKPVEQKEKPENGIDPTEQYINFEEEQAAFEGVGMNGNGIVFHDDQAEIHKQTDFIQTISRSKYISKHFKAVAEDPKMEAISCQDFGIRHKIKKALKEKGLVEFKSTFCSAQNGMMIFDPYGDLYTCWETVGMDQHIVGSYRDGLELDEEELENWYGRNISKTPACSRCKYAFFCGGGCQAHALREGRGYNAPYCDGYPRTFQKVTSDVYKSFVEEQVPT